MTHARNTDGDEVRLVETLHNFKRKHGNEAYLKLLAKFNVERWNDLRETDYGPVTAYCHAALADNADEGDDAEVDEGTDGATNTAENLFLLSNKIFGKRATEAAMRARAGKALQVKVDLAEAVEGETMKEKLNSMAKAHYAK